MKRLLILIVPLLLALQGARADNVAQAIWCSGNKTLYFDYCATVTAGSTYEGQTITAVYVVNTDTYSGSYPFEDAKAATKVDIKTRFSGFKPKSCYGWFHNFEQLTEVKGLDNLNTSEVTNMDFMFDTCGELTELDVSGFYVSKVTTAESMFNNCTKLKTIYCDNSWSIESTTSMFTGCTALKGAIAFSDSKVTGTMASPAGYFTARLTLSDNASNATYLSDWNGWYGDVTLSERTLYKNGYWNTLCLPFDVTIAGSVLDGGTAKVFDGDNTTLNNGKLTLCFKNAETTITAGTPFIIKWTTGDNLVSPTFKGVTIGGSAQAIASKDGKIQFAGQFSPFDITESNISAILYLGAENKIGYATEVRKLNSFRAHFEQLPASSSARISSITFVEDGTTAINDVQWSTDNGQRSINNGQWHTLDGRRLSGMPTAAGVYICNGRKIVIK